MVSEEVRFDRRLASEEVGPRLVVFDRRLASEGVGPRLVVFDRRLASEEVGPRLVVFDRRLASEEVWAHGWWCGGVVFDRRELVPARCP
jgi:hypothetical protein